MIMNKFFTFILLLCVGVIYATELRIADSAFESYLINESGVDINHDGKIQLSEVKCFSGGLYIQGRGIKNLKGIEAFENLTGLWCNDNEITSLDLSRNRALISVYCYNNKLKQLYIGRNNALKYLYCYNNQLRQLHLWGTPSLTMLHCYDNQLRWLGGLSFNKNLTDLYCYDNELLFLNLSKAKQLERLYCYNNQLSHLDVSKNKKLTDLYCYENNLVNLNIDGADSLRLLYCYNNVLRQLDASSNCLLEHLYCYNNSIQRLDVSGATSLELLYCYNNNIKSLDVSNNKELTDLLCYNNELNFLNIKNGANTNLTSFSATGNADLTCIQVDDQAYAESEGCWYIDCTAYYRENCCDDDAVFFNEITVGPNPVVNVLKIFDKGAYIKNVRIYPFSSTDEILCTQDRNIDLTNFNLCRGLYRVHIEGSNNKSTTRLIYKK